MDISKPSFKGLLMLSNDNAMGPVNKMRNTHARDEKDDRGLKQTVFYILRVEISSFHVFVRLL